MRLAAIAVIVCACQHDKPQWAADEPAAFARARAEHSGVLIEMYAAWAVPCEELDRELRGKRVETMLFGSFVPVRIDVSDTTDATEELRARYHADTLPALVLVSTEGLVVGRVDRLVSEDELVGIIQRATVQLHGGTMHP
jgi:thiol:disulfide interchange protein